MAKVHPAVFLLVFDGEKEREKDDLSWPLLSTHR